MGRKKGCCCACCTPVVTISVIILVGVLIASLGAAAIPFFNDLYKKEVKKQLVMENGNEAYNTWQNPPVPVYIEYYIFNYTNFNEVIQYNAKPNVTQVGPYKYREARINTILSYNEYNITYLQNYSYIFEPSLSCANCSESDTFYVPNFPILAVAKIIHDYLKNTNRIVKFLFNLIIEKYLENLNSWTLFKNLTAYQLLWGYTDPFLKNVLELETKLQKIGIKLPFIDPFVKLQRNGSDGAYSVGNLTIVTGKEDIDQVQNIVAWRGKRVAPYWKTPFGEMINGSDGSHYQPFLKRNQKIYTFVTDICRSIYFEYLEDRTLKDISLYRFHTTAALFANKTINPDNAAFCNDEKCWGSGLLPVGQCQEGNPPVFMSAPHFYQGDESLSQAINGLYPQEALHATYLDIEPITGITMEAHKKLQINILAQKDDTLKILQHLRNDDNFLPILWVHEVALIDDESANKFKREVLKPKQILTIVQYSVLALGAFIVFVALIAGIVVKMKKNTYNKLIDDDSPQSDPEAAGSINPVLV